MLLLKAKEEEVPTMDALTLFLRKIARFKIRRSYKQEPGLFTP